MPHEVVTVDWEGRPVDAFVPAPLAELGPLGATAQRDAARAEGMLSASAVRHDPRLEVAARIGGGEISDSRGIPARGVINALRRAVARRA